MLPLFLLKVWDGVTSFLKKYWQYIVAFFAGVFAVLTLKKKFSSETQDAEPIRQSADKQVDTQIQIRHDEVTQIDEAGKKLEKDLAHVQQQYVVNKKDLDDKKKEEIKTIIKDHQGDPVALAEKLSKVTGFKIIMPEK